MLVDSELPQEQHWLKIALSALPSSTAPTPEQSPPLRNVVLATYVLLDPKASAVTKSAPSIIGVWTEIRLLAVLLLILQ